MAEENGPAFANLDRFFSNQQKPRERSAARKPKVVSRDSLILRIRARSASCGKSAPEPESDRWQSTENLTYPKLHSAHIEVNQRLIPCKAPKLPSRTCCPLPTISYDATLEQEVLSRDNPSARPFDSLALDSRECKDDDAMEIEDETAPCLIYQGEKITSEPPSSVFSARPASRGRSSSSIFQRGSTGLEIFSRHRSVSAAHESISFSADWVPAQGKLLEKPIAEKPLSDEKKCLESSTASAVNGALSHTRQIENSTFRREPDSCKQLTMPFENDIPQAGVSADLKVLPLLCPRILPLKSVNPFKHACWDDRPMSWTGIKPTVTDFASSISKTVTADASGTEPSRDLQTVIADSKWLKQIEKSSLPENSVVHISTYNTDLDTQEPPELNATHATSHPKKESCSTVQTQHADQYDTHRTRVVKCCKALGTSRKVALPAFSSIFEEIRIPKDADIIVLSDSEDTEDKSDLNAEHCGTAPEREHNEKRLGVVRHKRVRDDAPESHCSKRRLEPSYVTPLDKSKIKSHSKNEKDSTDRNGEDEVEDGGIDVDAGRATNALEDEDSNLVCDDGSSRNTDICTDIERTEVFDIAAARHNDVTPRLVAAILAEDHKHSHDKTERFDAAKKLEEGKHEHDTNAWDTKLTKVFQISESADSQFPSDAQGVGDAAKAVEEGDPDSASFLPLKDYGHKIHKKSLDLEACQDDADLGSVASKITCQITVKESKESRANDPTVLLSSCTLGESALSNVQAQPKCSEPDCSLVRVACQQRLESIAAYKEQTCENESSHNPRVQSCTSTTLLQSSPQPKVSHKSERLKESTDAENPRKVNIARLHQTCAKTHGSSVDLEEHTSLKNDELEVRGTEVAAPETLELYRSVQALQLELEQLASEKESTVAESAQLKLDLEKLSTRLKVSEEKHLVTSQKAATLALIAEQERGTHAKLASQAQTMSNQLTGAENEAFRLQSRLQDESNRRIELERQSFRIRDIVAKASQQSEQWQSTVNAILDKFDASLRSIDDKRERLRGVLNQKAQGTTPKCLICMTDPVQVCYVPCGHRSVCPKCDTQLDKCPVCRGFIRERIKIFDAGV